MRTILFLFLTSPLVYSATVPSCPVAVVASAPQPASFATPAILDRFLDFHRQLRPNDTSPLNRTQFQLSLALHARKKAGPRVREVRFANEKGEKTTIKLDASSRQLMILNDAGQLATYLSIPAHMKSIAAFNPDSLLNGLCEPVSYEGRIYPRVLAGEDMGEYDSMVNVFRHFDKHVLGLEEAVTGLDLAKWSEHVRNLLQDPGGYATDFPDIRDDYLEGFEKTLPDDPHHLRKILRKKSVERYFDAAKRFARSNAPTVLTIRRVTRYDGGVGVMAFRFDPLTDEYAILNPQTRQIITYYKLGLDRSNLSLDRMGRSPVRTPLEFYFVISSLALSTRNEGEEEGVAAPPQE